MAGRVHLGARGVADLQPLLTDGQLRRDQAYLHAPHVPKDKAVKYGDEKRGWFDIRPSSHLKRRIPATSVVNLVCTMQGPLYGVTAAQTIWFLNLIAFCVHFAFFWWTIILICGWDGKERHLHAQVYRIRANWTSPDVDGYNIDLADNDQGFDIGVCTAVWFGITAGFHFLALIAGLWERWWMVYWRQLDDAFAWWCVAHAFRHASMSAVGMLPCHHAGQRSRSASNTLSEGSVIFFSLFCADVNNARFLEFHSFVISSWLIGALVGCPLCNFHLYMCMGMMWSISLAERSLSPTHC